MWLVSAWPVGGNLPIELKPGEYTIGRSKEHPIVIYDSSISRIHARLRVAERGDITIEDLGSRNGTFVNHRRISGTHVLSPGDRIDIGGHPMEIELESREDRPHRETLAVTGEYQPPPSDLDDTLDTLTETGQIPIFSKTARR